MKKFFTVLILLVSVSLVFGTNQTFYVSTAGSDDTGDGSIGSPWASISHALITIVDPSMETIINVVDGTYTEAGITDQQGGGPYSNLTIQGSSATNVIIQAHASSGSASDRVFTFYAGTGGSTITLNNLTIQNGKLSSGEDGAGIGGAWSSLTINNCHIKDNETLSSIGLGGGIYCSGHSLTMTNCTISGNSADYGGGLDFQGSTVLLTNCTFSGNTATNSGGAIFHQTQSTCTLMNCTIANNTANEGGGIYMSAATAPKTMIIKNTIVGNNTANANGYEDFYLYQGIVSDGGYNIVEFPDDISDFPSSMTGSRVIDLSANLETNNTSTGTPTLKTTVNSVAIDAGDATNAPTTDQRGADRNGITDIGAYEYYDDSGSLPVELTSFTATSTDAGVLLSWTTATEVNNYGFEIEASSNLENWTVIGFVDGHGNSNSPKDYSFVASVNSASKLSFRLKQIDVDGSFEYSDIVTVELDGKMEYKLAQNHPNPFNPTTTISFSIEKAGIVKLNIYNILGEVVSELVSGNLEAGFHNYQFDATNLTSGIYFYSISINGFTEVKKMNLVK